MVAIPACGRGGGAGSTGGGSAVASSTVLGTVRGAGVGAAPASNVRPHCPQNRACAGTTDPH